MKNILMITMIVLLAIMSLFTRNQSPIHQKDETQIINQKEKTFRRKLSIDINAINKANFIKTEEKS